MMGSQGIGRIKTVIAILESLPHHV
jgi:hypothetical protein